MTKGRSKVRDKVSSINAHLSSFAYHFPKMQFVLPICQIIQLNKKLLSFTELYSVSFEDKTLMDIRISI